MGNTFSAPVLEKLQKAGWFEGRKVPVRVPPQYDLFPKAHEILAEFGDLEIGEAGPGIDCATCKINVNPMRLADLKAPLTFYGSTRGICLFPLGEVLAGCVDLIIDDSGKIYLYGHDLINIADSFSDALELLLLGKRPAKK